MPITAITEEKRSAARGVMRPPGRGMAQVPHAIDVQPADYGEGMLAGAVNDLQDGDQCEPREGGDLGPRCPDVHSPRETEVVVKNKRKGS